MTHPNWKHSRPRARQSGDIAPAAHRRRPAARPTAGRSVVDRVALHARSRPAARHFVRGAGGEHPAASGANLRAPAQLA